MHESHHPHVHGKSWTALVLELAMIGVGVFLGLQVDQWKENRAHREAAHAALENFRTEMADNRNVVRQVASVHAAYADSMRISEQRGDRAPTSVREVFRRLGFHGLAPVRFQHTAWDLALATQSLSYLPPPLAFRIARVYTVQQQVQELQGQLAVSLFNPSALDDAHVLPFMTTLGAFVGDATIQEPAIVTAYDKMIPRIDSALAAMPK